MAKRLTPEEKVARDLQRKLDKEAARQAKITAQRAAWDAQRKAERDAFEAGLTDHIKAAIATILVPVRQEQGPDGAARDVYESEFIQSLATQLKSWGKLSPNQLASVVKQYDRKLETEKLVAVWPTIAEGGDVMVLCTVQSIEQRPNVGFGPSWKIKLKSHYGRSFHINTAAQRFLSVAEVALKEGSKVNVQGKAGWVSPDTRIVVLDKKGLYFQGL